MTDGIATRVSELVMPALRWNSGAARYDCEGATLDESLDLGVGGFCFFGGRADEARRLIAEITARSRVPLLIASDLERGAGQQFAGLTGLPPLAALASLDDDGVLTRAARITAREARSIGVNWILAPVLDLDIEPDNPIVGTRSLGADPAAVARRAVAWIGGCEREGVMACAKHFPGHGRTTTDSHSGLPVVDASREELDATDLVPFRAAAAARVGAVMSAHVAFPSLDPSGDPATISRPILRSLLRRELDFSGLTVTDAMIMEGIRGSASEGDVAVRALNAGIDLLLYPQRVADVCSAIAGAIDRGELSAEHVRQSLDRRNAALESYASRPAAPPSADDADWGTAIALRVINVVRGAVPGLRSRVDLLVVDDDVGGPYPAPSREPFIDALRRQGMDISVVTEAKSNPLVVALFGDIRAWKGRPGYSTASRDAIRRAAAASSQSVVVQFSHPRLAAGLDAPNVVAAWGGEAPMQRAAAVFLAS